MTRACLQAILSHWRRNPIQLFTFLAGLALATALWAGVQAINAEARASYDAAAATLGEGRFAQAKHKSADTFSQETYISLRRAGWQVSPVIESRLRVDDRRIRIVGLDFLTAPQGVGPDTDEDVSLLDLISSGVIFADAETAARLETRTAYRVIVDPNVAPGTAITDIGIAQALLDLPLMLTRLIIADTQPKDLPDFADIAPDLTITPAQSASDVGRMTDSFHLNLTAFGFLSFAVGLFIVHGTIGLAFEQRRPMIRTMRSLGVPLRRLIVILAVELFLLAFLAGAIGVALGYVIAAALLPDVAVTLQGLYGTQVAGSLEFRASWWLSGLAIALVGTLAAGTGALVQIARMPLLASARPRAWALADLGKRRAQGLAALALVALACVLIFVQGGLVKGFVQLGALLLGAALFLPLILDGVLRLGQRFSTGVIGQWFWADTRQQLPGLSLALMALLLAVAANIGVTTMVSSFRVTFVGFLDQRLASELYVRSETAEQSPALEAYLIETADEVMPLLSADVTLAGRPGELYGVRVGNTYRENWAFLDGIDAPWDAVANGAGTVINEQLARRAGLWVNDEITVASGVTLPVVGIYGDYGNPIGQAVISEARFSEIYSEVIPRQFGVRSEDPVALRERIVEEFGLPNGQMINQADIKSTSLDIFERTFTVTGALNVLTLAVAAFAILMSLLTLASLRLPQLAPVWALGLSRRQLAVVEMVRAILLATLTAICALPVGLALAWILLTVINVEAFGWQLPMFLFPQDYARLGIFALIAAALAALWPAFRLGRTPPNALLKVFASER